MMNFTDLTGLAGIALAIITLVLHLPVLGHLRQMQKAGLALIIFVVLMLPFGGLSVIEFVRGVSGDLSITTLLLLLALSKDGILTVTQKYRVLFLVAVSAILLYPFALGLGIIDLYRWGFGGMWFLAVVLLVAVLAWVRQCPVVAAGIALAVLAWSVGWYESNNLWDYLLDPWLSIYAMAALVSQAVLLLRRKIT